MIERWEKSGKDDRHIVELLDEQLSVLDASLEFLRSYPPTKNIPTFVSGCSLGGILSLLYAAQNNDIAGAINFSGAAILWNQAPALVESMKAAASRAKVPLLLLQAQNDFSIEPTLVLSEVMKNSEKDYRSKIFPAHGETHRQGHAFCAGGRNPPWGDEVMPFLRFVGLKERPRHSLIRGEQRPVE